MSNIIVSPSGGLIEFNTGVAGRRYILHLRTAPIRLDATGGNSWITGSNVGIGTASPSDVLHVNLAQDGDKIHVSHGAMSALEIQRNGSDDTMIKQGRAYTSAIQLKTAADDASSGFPLKGQGAGNGSFVGIGTGEPPYPLTIRYGTSFNWI